MTNTVCPDCGGNCERILAGMRESLGLASDVSPELRERVARELGKDVEQRIYDDAREMLERMPK